MVKFVKYVWVPISICRSIYRRVTERKWEVKMSSTEGDETRKSPTMQANCSLDSHTFYYVTAYQCSLDILFLSLTSDTQ